MKLITLDLGSTFGVASGDTKHPFVSYSDILNLAPGRSFDGESFCDFYYWMKESVRNQEHTEPTHIVCEKPNAKMPGYHGIRIHFGMYGIVKMMEGLFEHVTVSDVPALTVKKFWTGTGRADKEFMVDQTQLLYPHVTDDNESDAIALWHYCQSEIYGDYNADQ